MQQQEPHELMPVRQSPGEAAQVGQAVLMGPQRDPPFRQDPKTRERTGSRTADGPVWSKQEGEWLPAKRLGETGEESLARYS